MKNKIFQNIFILSIFIFSCTHSQRKLAEDSKALEWTIDWPEVAHFSNFEIEKRIERLEQVCVQGQSIEEQIQYANIVKSRMHQYSDLLSDRFQKLGYKSVDLKELRQTPKTSLLKYSLKEWDDLESWKQEFTNAPQTLDRCELLESAWLNSLLRLQVLEPSKAICRFSDILCENPKELEYRNDMARAFWELRFFDAGIKPKMLQSYSRSSGMCDENQLWKKASKRIAFLKDTKIRRRPLGYAIGMCGRSMTAHYLDDEVVGKKEKTPEGWSKGLSSQRSLEETKNLILEIEAGAQ